MDRQQHWEKVCRAKPSDLAGSLQVARDRLGAKGVAVQWMVATSATRLYRR